MGVVKKAIKRVVKSKPCVECGGSGIGSPAGDTCGHCKGTGKKT